MAHPTARLNQFGRQLLIDRVLRDGWTVATAAEAQGISRATGHKRVRRYRLEGAAGLADRSSRPHRSPRATPAQDVQRIVAARREWRWDRITQGGSQSDRTEELMVTSARLSDQSPVNVAPPTRRSTRSSGGTTVQTRNGTRL